MVIKYLGTDHLQEKNLKKFKNNLNLHPSFLPYAKGKDPYVWTIQKNFHWV